MTRFLSALSCLGSAIATLIACSGAATAQPFPARQVKIVVPYPISGPTDIRGTSRMSRSYRLMAPHAPPAITDTLARIAQQAIRADTPHPVVLARQPGGATTRGALSVARATADGHTLLLASNATLIINPHYFHGVEYDPVRDFILVTPLATMPYVVMVGAALPVEDVRGLAAWLKVRPGEINFASSGDGSTGHLAGELFRRMARVNFVHVSYNSGVSALNGLATRQVSLMFAALPLALAYFPSEHFRPLAVTSARRLEQLPDVPTVSESGLPGYEIEGWYGLFAPSGTPSMAAAWLRAQISALSASAAIRSHLRGLGLEPPGMTIEQFATRINSELDKWAPVLRASRLPKEQGGRQKDEG
ncbi:MAG: Bug family tripartite tricarboxylate transporter substrate binding protein [Burkholderiales bacterium]